MNGARQGLSAADAKKHPINEGLMINHDLVSGVVTLDSTGKKIDVALRLPGTKDKTTAMKDSSKILKNRLSFGLQSILAADGTSYKPFKIFKNLNIDSDDIIEVETEEGLVWLVAQGIPG